MAPSEVSPESHSSSVVRDGLIHIPPTFASASQDGSGDAESYDRELLLKGLNAPAGSKSLPTTLLYDEHGLELYDDITTHAGDHYYLFPTEEAILKTHSEEIIRVMCAGDRGNSEGNDGSIVLELGAGSLRKTAHLISALSSAHPAGKPSGYTYYALDLAPVSIKKSIHSLQPLVKNNVNLEGLVTDYESGLRYIESVRHARAPHDNSPPEQGSSDPESTDDVNQRGRVQRSSSISGSVSREPRLDRDSKGAPPPASIEGDSSLIDTVPKPIKAFEPKASSLPVEGERIPHPIYPETPPHSSPATPLLEDTRKLDVVTDELVSDSSKAQAPPLHLLFLGSSLGNFNREESAAFLRGLPLHPGSNDTLLLGIDGRNDKAKVERAYNDPEGYTAKFILNALDVAAKVLDVDQEGEKEFKDRFDYHGVYNVDIGRHEAYYKAKESFSIHPASLTNPISFEKDELVNIEYSYKYSDADAYQLFQDSDLRPITRWQDPESLYSLWLVERPAFSFPRLVTPSSPKSSGSNLIPPLVPVPQRERGGVFGIPTLDEYKALWKAWDEITLGMIPEDLLFQKPIDLRHICLFYLGHIPTFLDIHLSRLLGEPHTEPEHFKDIFERGIDPHVDDPTQIHPHSEVPTKMEDWPSLESILGFRDRVRERVARLYEALEREDEKVVKLGRKVDRVLWMCLEHEGWHAETLLYMLIQRAGTPNGTRPPKGFAPPTWLTLPTPPSQFDISWPLSAPSAKDIIILQPQTFTVGHDDFEADDSRVASLYNAPHASYDFGWDLEHPKRSVSVEKAVYFEKACATNAEFLAFYKAASSGSLGSHSQQTKPYTYPLPASWVQDTPNGEIKVRTLYGSVPFSVAGDWPFVGSYDELEEFAKAKGGRIPTEVELRAFLDGYMEANESSTVGFREWSFTRALDPVPEKGLRGHNGGVWEWSSTRFDNHEGFIPSVIYPGFSTDFFDDKHNIVLGASFATIPRLAQRRTVRNYYQHNYRYAWIGARIVYDELPAKS